MLIWIWFYQWRLYVFIVDKRTSLLSSNALIVLEFYIRNYTRNSGCSELYTFLISFFIQVLKLLKSFILLRVTVFAPLVGTEDKIRSLWYSCKKRWLLRTTNYTRNSGCSLLSIFLISFFHSIPKTFERFCTSSGNSFCTVNRYWE